VKAVNLIPANQRRGGGAGRSGGAVYALLAALGLVVIASVVYVLSANTVTSRKDELARLQAQTQAAQAEANALSPYKQFSALKQTRITTIQQLASSRFDWERVMRKLAIVVPSDVWLTSLLGTVSPAVTVDAAAGGAGGGSTTGLRSALPVPAIELVGCTTGQAQVSRFMSRLRAIDGVTRVSLSSSDKGGTSAPATGGATGSSPGGSGQCGNSSSAYPRFNMVVFFGGTAQAAPGVGGATGGSAPTPAQQAGATATNAGFGGSK
jgi:Tfp pilus assembly protein PilN